MTLRLTDRVARGVVLLGIALASALIGEACANAGMPPGGPPDVAPPIVVRVTPMTMTVGSKAKEIEIKFDEVISETPKGGADLEQLVFISPRVKQTIVDWHRDRITIRPKGGWMPNIAYSVQISPGIQDLRNNSIDSSISVVFSTGGAIPTTHVVGVAFDWIIGRGGDKTLIQAIAKDSTTYQVLSDSVGRFDLPHVPPGEYVVRAIIDRNKNRVLDPTEPFDTVRIALTGRADVELYAFPHDTVGLRISDVLVASADSFRVIKLTFDKPLAPGQLLLTSSFRVLDADSATTGVTIVQTAADRLRADSLKSKAREDSIAAKNKADTTTATRLRLDSLARSRRLDSAAVIDRLAREARRLVALRGGRPVPVRDTTPPPKMKRPPVSADLYLTLEQPLKPGKAYRIQAGNIRSLSGTVKSPARQFTTPRVQEKKDSTAAAPRKPPP